MQLVAIKALRLSGAALGTMIEVPARICQIEDGTEQYVVLADYINEEYDTGDDPVIEIVDAQAY